MKIAFLNKYQNSVNRGAETYVSELSKRLSKHHDVHIISDVNYFKILKNKYDLIIPTNGRLQVFITKIICILSGAKMLVSGQSGIGLDDRLNLYAMPNLFVALSTKALNWSKTVNPLVKSVYVPNGVDLKRFTPSSKLNGNGRKIILTVGAFTEQKRHDLVIKAVSKIADAYLIIAGGGGDRKEEIEKLCKKMLSGRYEIIETTNEKMPDIYKRANLFTLASKPYESFGIVIVEAMASNVPVVVTDDPIRMEIVGDAGLFVDPTNLNKYVETIEKALSTNWGDKPRKQAEKFSWDEVAKQYEDLFSEII